MNAERLGSRRIVTSDMVLVEFLNHVSRFGAANTIRQLISDPNVEIVPQTSQQFMTALELENASTSVGALLIAPVSS